jgi:hypothetical protein
MIPPTLGIVGITSWDQPLISRVHPSSLVTDSIVVDDDTFVEHVRISSRDALKLVPGLQFGRPSRLRDAAAIALGAGASSVDLVLARIRDEGGKELQPWELYRPEFVYAVDAFLAKLVGTVVLYPDIGGPAAIGPGTGIDVEERVHRFVQTVRAHSPGWTERYQLAMLDDVGATGDDAIRLLRSTAATDSAVCRWVGQPGDLDAHGWRSAASVVGGLIAARPNDLLSGVSGFRVPLQGGRAVDAGRSDALLIGDRHMLQLPDDEYYVDVVPRTEDGTAFIRTEGTMRAPVGAWSIPAIRLSKVIHWRIMQVASRFVFDMADIGRAVGLATAVTKALRPFSRVGVLSGPDGADEPFVRGGVVRDPAAPGLRVEINAQLKPWAHKVNLRVNLRPGGAPVIREVE